MRLHRLLFLIALIVGRSFLSAAADRPPNVVLIISDDQGWTDYGFMGHPQIKTPHLDKLASEGLCFPHGYSVAPLCRPSLATIITGLYPHQHKIFCNDPPYPTGKTMGSAMQDAGYRAARKEMEQCIQQAPTIPRLLAQKGYVSFQSGKWWEGNFSTGGFTAGMTQGDYAKGGRHGDAGLNIGRHGLQPVFDFINQAGDKPFFVWYAPMMPHQPHTPPERLLNKYKDKTDSLHIAKYWAMCEWFDETCGQLLDYLDQKGLAKNTIVLYLADNGWIQEPDKATFAARSKKTPYEGGLRTPIMIRWPGKVKPAREEKTLASSIDFAPTILAACGLKPTADMDGINLLDASARHTRDTIFGAAYLHTAIDVHDPLSTLAYRWLIRSQWKLIVPYPLNSPDATTELYDLYADPHELKNLAAEQPARVKGLQKQMDAWWPARAKKP